MLLLLTKNTNLHGFYEDYRHNGVYYLGYTDDIEIAEIYAEQFVTTSYKVYYLEVPETIIKGMRIVWKIDITELLLYENYEGKKYVFSNAEINYMEDIMADCGGNDEFLDLELAIENLKRFKHKYAKKASKYLQLFYDAMVDYSDEDLTQSIIDSEDIAENYWFFAKRLQLFDMNYTK